MFLLYGMQQKLVTFAYKVTGIPGQKVRPKIPKKLYFYTEFKRSEMLEFELTEDYIELIKLLKVLQIAENGAMAKTLVENGEVVRNGEPESRKRAKIRKGEVIKVLGQTIKVI